MTSGQNPTRRPDRAALAVAVVLAILAGVIFWDTSRLAKIASYSGIGPGTVPFVIACCLMALAVWTVFAAFRNDFPERERQELSPVFWVIAGLAAQMLLLKIAGFSIATGLLFACAAAAFGRKKLWATIPIGIALSLVVWLIFSQLLQLALPAGPLERLIVG